MMLRTTFGLPPRTSIWWRSQLMLPSAPCSSRSLPTLSRTSSKMRRQGLVASLELDRGAGTRVVYAALAARVHTDRRRRDARPGRSYDRDVGSRRRRVDSLHEAHPSG